MDYLTNYYKNLCEELQSKIDLIEAGLKKAMKSISSERREKELLRQEARKKRKLKPSTEQEENIEAMEMQIDFEKPERRRAIQKELKSRGMR